APALEAPAQPLVPKLGQQLAQIDDEQIVGRCVERKTIALAGLAASPQQGFVITGDDACLASVGAGKLVWGKMRFEKRAHRGVAARIDGRRGFAAFAPD